MCEPTTLMAIGGTALSSMQANKAANAQSEYQDMLHEENRKQANAAAVLSYQQNQAEEIQAGEAALQQQMANDLRARELTATSNVAQAASGGMDNTGAIGGRFIRQGLEANTQITQNLERDRANFALNNIATRNNQYSRIQSVSKGRGKVPTFGAMDALQTGLAGGQAYFGGANGAENTAKFKALGNPDKMFS